MKRFLLVVAAVALAAPAVVAQTFSNVSLADANVAPGSWVLAQVITQTASGTFTVTQVKVVNTATDPLSGTDVERIEVRRASDGKVMGAVATGFANFTTAGIEIPTTANNAFNDAFDLEIWVKVQVSASLRQKLQLGTTSTPTVITTNNPMDHNVAYPTAAATFTTQPVWFMDVPTGELPVYREQKFLAARFEVNNLSVGASRTVSRVDVWNDGDPIKLTGAYLAKIEVIRARDGNRLGEKTSGFGNFTAAGPPQPWVEISTGSHNTIAAYSLEVYEIWITLRNDAPTGHRLRLKAQVRLTGTGYDVVHSVWGTAPRFIVGAPVGFEELTNQDLTGGRIYSGQRFLAQRIEARDNDLDPYNVTIESFMVQNVADSGARLAETQVAKVEVRRGSDGALLGEVTDASGLNAGGVRIPPAETAIGNNTVADDTSETFEIWVTLKTGVPHGRTLKLQTTVWHTESGYLSGPVVPGNAAFETGPDAGEGFETATPVTMSNRTVFQGVLFLAQRLDLRDNDPDPYDVTITSLMIRNYVPDNPLADQHVAKIEVRRKSDGALLGEVTDPVGLSLAGVRVTTGANNLVPDDTSVELEIWVTLKSTAPSGRKLQLESVVWHTEGTATKATTELVGPATFTTAIGQAPTGVDFSWTPAAPEAGIEVTFTPGTGIADPSGDITKATFHWDFGDGKTAQTTGSASVKHTYAIGGTYQVTLTVTGEGGLASSKTKPVEVTGKQPVVDFTFTPAEPAVGQAVTFTSQVTDPATPPLTPYTYAWAFGDGGTSTAANPQHTYTAAGTYTVILSVTNSRGEVGRKEKTITVVASPVNRRPVVTAIAVSPAAPVVGQTITFTATANDADDDAITGYEWKLGDETVVATTANSTTHTFTTANVFRIQVRARDAGGFGEWFSLDVYVRPTGGAAVGTKALDNPARTQCRIQILLPPGATDVSIQIFDMLGREVRRSEVAGTQFTWDLKDGNGRSIADGLYFYLITATVGEKTERSEIGRILVVR